MLPWPPSSPPLPFLKLFSLWEAYRCVSQNTRTHVECAHTKSSLHAVREDTSPKSLEAQLDTQQFASITANSFCVPLCCSEPCRERRLLSHPLGYKFMLLSSHPPSPSSHTSMEIQPLRFCFFGFDCLRFDWSSSNRFCCCSRCRGRLFLRFVLADSWRVSNCLGGFVPVLIHFLCFASYGFALLLLLRKESLGRLKYLCSLLCLKGKKYVYWRESIWIRVTSQKYFLNERGRTDCSGQTFLERQCPSGCFPDVTTSGHLAPQ